jgi:hypothetical protein
MDKPDQRLFDADITSAEFRTGALKGYWGLAATDILAEQPAWPNRILWIAAAQHEKAPDRYYLQLDLSEYRTHAPTGTFWNPNTKAALEFSLRPKGRPGSRVAMVFRTDWENGRAFYHPYDRVAAKGHADWIKNQPSLIWDSDHTIVHYLEEIHSLLNSGDYLGL